MIIYEKNNVCTKLCYLFDWKQITHETAEATGMNLYMKNKQNPHKS